MQEYPVTERTLAHILEPKALRRAQHISCHLRASSTTRRGLVDQVHRVAAAF